jgi:hypothetical protein
MVVLLPATPRAETSPPSATSSSSFDTDGSPLMRSIHHRDAGVVLIGECLGQTRVTRGVEDEALRHAA